MAADAGGAGAARGTCGAGGAGMMRQGQALLSGERILAAR